MKSSFIAMGFTPTQVDRAIEEAGEGNVDLILETLITYSVFMDVPLKVCEARDPKGLYKLAQAGFTEIVDPQINSEITPQMVDPVVPLEIWPKLSFHSWRKTNTCRPNWNVGWISFAKTKRNNLIIVQNLHSLKVLQSLLKNAKK